MQFKDAQGRLCYNQHHVAVNRIEYDNNGLVADVRNYGIDDKPCTNTLGYFHQNFIYNHKGEIIETSFYNISDKPVHNNLGIHKINIKYDNSGYRVIEAHAYNMESLPFNCVLFNGAAWVRLGYRGSSKWVSEVYFFGVDNQPIETNAGAKLYCERDSYGQIIAYRYYNEDNKLTSNSFHCAIMRLDYNEMGMEVNRSFYDENERPTTRSGVSRISKSYTKTGLMEKICIYDTLQQLQNGPEGWARQEYEYINGVIKANSYYGNNGESVEILGVHKYIYEIDECGYVLSQSAYNKELCPTINSQIGAHKVVNLYDDNRRIIGRDYFDAINSDPFVCVRYKLNQRGMQIEQLSYNARMELIESPLNYGVASLESEYDSQDRVTHIIATNRSGQKLGTSYGIAEALFSYENNVYEAVYLDPKGNIVNNNGLTEPVAYTISYMTETGLRLFSKTIKVSDVNKRETIREAYCYDPQNENVRMAIRCEDWRVHVYDALEKKSYSFFSFEDEYDVYVHKVDSLQNDIEKKYGKSKLYKYVKSAK